MLGRKVGAPLPEGGSGQAPDAEDSRPDGRLLTSAEVVVDWPGNPEIPGVIERFAEGVVLPEVRLVRQRGSPSSLDDVEGVARREARRAIAAGRTHSGPLAVCVGSRGIADLHVIVRAVVDELTAAGAEPFVVPAMGSHGGGTAEGQLAVLAAYGITEDTLGIPLRATMETEIIGHVGDSPVYVDRNVVAAGQAFLVSRVKSHTDFSGTIESGPTKMAAIGLGKQRGAHAVHSRGLQGLRELMPEMGRFVTGRLVVGALAIVENQRGETASITGLAREEIGGPVESMLLERSRELLPKLPFRDLDVLVVEKMGKDVSGAGMDPNVIGRWLVTGLEEPPSPVRCVVALELTEASHGNATGVGLADIVTERLVGRIDLAALYTNGLTSGWPSLQRSRIPVVMPTDREAILAAVALFGAGPARPLRLVWIQDTLHTEALAVSEGLWGEAERRDDLEIAGHAVPIAFDEQRRIVPLASVGNTQ